MNDFGNYIRKLRNEKSLSLRKASELIGISHTYLDSLEKGHDPRTKKERKPTPEVLQKISNYYKVNYEYLLFLAGYISEEMYDKQSKLKEEIEAREDMLSKVKENISPLQKQGEVLRHEYEKLKESLTSSPNDETGKKMLAHIKKSFESVLNKQDKAFLIVNKAEKEVNDLENELNEINQLIEKRKQSTNTQYGKELDNEILLSVKRILNENKGRWQEATPKEIKKMAEDQYEFLEGNEHNIEDLLSLDYYVRYKGKLLTKEDKEKILKLIEISFN